MQRSFWQVCCGQLLERDNATTRQRTVLDQIVTASFELGVPFTLVRLSLGTVLLTAATFKVEVLFDSEARLPLHLAATVVFGEFALAAWLFSGVKPLAAWWAALITFSGFALVAGIKTWHGAPDCGCFGAIKTPAWFALTIDLLALTALVSSYRGCRMGKRSTSKLCGLGSRIGIAFVLVLATKAIVTLSTGGREVTADDPSKWVGQRLPLLDDMDDGEALSSGDWIVIIHRPTCAKCKDVLSRATSCVQLSSRIALVELLPANASTNTGRSANGILLGNLRGREFMALPTPLVLQLIDGRVVFAGDRFPPSGRE